MEFGDILDRARAGDEDAINTMIGMARDYLLVIANDRRSAELQAFVNPSDFVQETLGTACVKLGSFRSRTPQAWKAWLRKILLEKINQEHRRLERRPRVHHFSDDAILELLHGGLSFAAAAPGDDVETRELRAAVQSAIRRLPRENAEALIWHHFDGQTFETIGRTLKVSQDAARHLRNRAIGLLREELGSIYGSR
jgi:RNA polymerase sigma factor (sigma-70 family)